MIGPAHGAKIYLATQPIDFRKGMDGLAAYVKVNVERVSVVRPCLWPATERQRKLRQQWTPCSRRAGVTLPGRISGSMGASCRASDCWKTVRSDTKASRREGPGIEGRRAAEDEVADQLSRSGTRAEAYMLMASRYPEARLSRDGADRR